MRILRINIGIFCFSKFREGLECNKTQTTRCTKETEYLLKMGELDANQYLCEKAKRKSECVSPQKNEKMMRFGAF